MNTTPDLRVSRYDGGWVVGKVGTLTDDEAAAITFRAEPGQVVLGAYVEVVDDDGIRIGRIVKAELVEPVWDPMYVVVSIRLH